MEERTKLLVALGAAIAANCIPCFEYFYREAGAAGLSQKEIQEVVALASKVKQGAHVALKNSICDIMGSEEKHDLPRFSKTNSSCCS